MPTSPKKHILDWNQPLIPQLTRRLLQGVAGDYVDLGHMQVIVPTKQAGRRLREALALAMAQSGRGLLPPEIMTPDVFLAQAVESDRLASDAAQLTAWGLVLARIQPEHYQAVFPIAPTQSTGWCLGLAKRFMQLRADLGEAGYDFAYVAQALAETAYEPLRWKQLSELEQLYLAQLEAQDWLDPLQARRAAAAQFCPNASIRHIILAASPDTQRLPLTALEQATQHCEVEVWIYGDCGQAELHDSWGRPKTELWQSRSLPLEQWKCHLESLQSPDQAARHIAALTKPQPPEAVAIGLADPTLTAPTADAFRREQIPAFNPEGEPLPQSEIGRLTDLLCSLAEAPGTNVIRSLLQHPDIWDWLHNNEAAGLSQNQVLRELDRLFENHLAPDLDGILYFAQGNDKYAALHRSAQSLATLAKQLNRSSGFAQSLAEVLQTIYQNKAISSHTPHHEQWLDCAKALRRLLDQYSECEQRFQKLNPEWVRSAFRAQLSQARVHPERPKNAHDLLGWLELLWNDAPHLILAGMNEGVVPESVVGDAFLPDSLRAELGLRTNAQRFARDAYLLEALCRRRAHEAARIDLIVPQVGSDQSPQKPSRLLFLAEPDQLLPRVEILFSESSTPANAESHSIPWKFTPPARPLPEKLSVSALKTYLNCPFRFFLRHIMGLNAVDIQTREMSAAAFGNLFHNTVAELEGQYFDASIAPSTLIAKLHQIAEHKRNEQYGKRLSFALKLQEVALLARLENFVHIQVKDLQAHGSRTILDTERPFHINLAGMQIRGRIDRIDRRDDGRLELIDYKTSDSEVTPLKAHLATVARKEPPAHLPEAAFFEHEGKRYRWTDLQLPLYLYSQRGQESERPSLAYFNLSKTAEKSGIERWDDFTESHLDSALACAEAVVERIKQGIFWPPNPDAETNYDEFAPLFPDGIVHSVEISAFENYVYA